MQRVHPRSFFETQASVEPHARFGSRTMVCPKSLGGGFMCVLPKIGVGPQNGWIDNGNPYFLMDDLGVPPFSETPMY